MEKLIRNTSRIIFGSNTGIGWLQVYETEHILEPDCEVEDFPITIGIQTPDGLAAIGFSLSDIHLIAVTLEKFIADVKERQLSE